MRTDRPRADGRWGWKHPLLPTHRLRGVARHLHRVRARQRDPGSVHNAGSARRCRRALKTAACARTRGPTANRARPPTTAALSAPPRAAAPSTLHRLSRRRCAASTARNHREHRQERSPPRSLPTSHPYPSPPPHPQPPPSQPPPSEAETRSARGAAVGAQACQRHGQRAAGSRHTGAERGWSRGGASRGTRGNGESARRLGVEGQLGPFSSALDARAVTRMLST